MTKFTTRRVRQWLSGVALIAIAATVAACGSEDEPAATKSGGAAKPAKVTVAIGGNSAFFWLHQIALDQGFFKDEGLEVETVTISGAPNVVRAVQSGSADFGVTSTDSVIKADMAGADIKMIGMPIATPVFSLMGRPGIESYEDLKGKSLGTSQLQQNTGLFLARMLAINGISDKDTEINVIGETKDRLSALKSGAIEAAPMLQPQDFQLQEEGYHVIARSTDDIKAINYIASFSSGQWLKENPDTAVAYLRAMLKATNFLHDPANKAASVDSLFNLNEVDKKYGEMTYDTYITNATVEVIPKDFAPTLEGVKAMEELMAAQGQLSEPLPDPGDFVDLTFIQKAAQG